MARRACPEFEFVCADVFESIVFETVPYQVVVLTEFLEHLEKDKEVMERIRPGRRVCGTVPNFPDPGHVRFFGSCQEVSERYAHLFTDWRVDEFLAGNTGRKFYLFDGIRNAVAG